MTPDDETPLGDELEKGCRQQRGMIPYCVMCSSNYAPHVFRRMTKLAASDAGTQAVIADTDGFVLEIISEVVPAFSHGANEDAYALVWCKALNVVFDPDYLCLEAQCDFPAVWRKMTSYRILDDFQKLFLRVGGSYGQLVKELNHKASKALEGARNTDCGADFD